MAVIDHPDYEYEAAHLTETREIIAREGDMADDAYADNWRRLIDARRGDPDAVPLREMMLARAEDELKNLRMALKKPYFTRVDFRPKDKTETERYYIGRYGVLRRSELEPLVVDWRSPIANLYYSGQVGPMKYSAPDGEVEGEMLLKRQFVIEDGALAAIFDTGVVSNDQYLQSVLGTVGSDRLREIVTTIQAEQNAVIRSRPDRPLVVQGVAGSGKTTIALHRIAYLLYAYRRQLMPENMMIIAPSPLFLNYISGVLPDLGVDHVRQTTFGRLVHDLFGAYLPPTDARDRLAQLLAAGDEERQKLTRILQAKGALSMEGEISSFMDRYEQAYARHGDIKYGPRTVMTGDDVFRYFTRDAGKFPLERRVSEFAKLLKRRVTDAAEIIIAQIGELCDKKAERLESSMPDGEERRARFRKLFSQRDAQINAARAGISDFVKEVLEGLPPLDPVEAYRAFWRERGGEAAEYTLARVSNAAIESEDVAPICMIAMRLFETERTDARHVVVDEAQDFSPLEFALLRRLFGHNSFTIVGDLMQGVHSYRGITDWGVLVDGLFGGNVTRHELVTSYRSTVEIIGAANRVARAYPVPGQTEAQPVLRHGEAPAFAQFDADAEQVEIIAAQVRQWRAEGFGSIAVIARDMDEARALHASLTACEGATDAALLDENSPEYSGGLIVAAATGIKGLEFDCVLLSDVGPEKYRTAPLDARVLYVCATRPLHRLAVLARRAPDGEGLAPLFAPQQ